MKAETYNLSNAANAAIYFGVDRMRGLRAIAATVLCRFARDISAGWKPGKETYGEISRIITRFRIPKGFMDGMIAGYDADK